MVLLVRPCPPRGQAPTRWATALALALAVCPGVALAQDGAGDEHAPTRVLRAHPRGADPIVVDGHLTEAAWARSSGATGFTERIPTPRARPPVDTEVRVLFDADALYVAVTMHLLPGEEPRALTLTRDSFRIYSDDAVTLKFDVTHDRRTTVGFAVNPANNQVDYVATENGATFRGEFDAVWQSATSIGSDTWVAEFRIPALALGLSSERGERILGFNVTRDHHARHATDDWTHLPPEFGPVSAAHYGDLRGIRGTGSGQPLTLLPYALVAWPADDRFGPDLPLRLRLGGDARMRVAQDLWAEVTALTDFAQVDLDDPVVNLDRFPLFLPEKRPFFLSGLDVFEFGVPGSAQLFFSRRIGLDADGNELPLYGGLKVYGREGPLSIGVLDVATALPSTNWSVARVRVNAGGSHIGAMATARHRLGVSDSGYAVGLDGSVRALDNRFEVSGSVAAEPTGPRSLSDRTSAFARIRYRGEALRPSASILHVGDDFDPDVGFVQRTGILRSRLTLPWVHRTRALGLEQLTLQAETRLDLSDETSKRLGGNAELYLEANWPSWGASLFAEAREEVVTEAFDLLPGLTIQPGTYRGVAVEYALFRSSTRNPNGSLRYMGSSAFFGGVIHTVTASLGLSLTPHVRIAATGRQSFITIPGHAPARALTVNSSVTVAPTTNLSADFAFQLNDVDRTTVALTRLRWRYLPGSDLFFVYRHAVDFDGNDEASVTAKLTFRLDAVL